MKIECSLEIERAEITFGNHDPRITITGKVLPFGSAINNDSKFHVSTSMNRMVGEILQEELIRIFEESMTVKTKTLEIVVPEEV